MSSESLSRQSIIRRGARREGRPGPDGVLARARVAGRLFVSAVGYVYFGVSALALGYGVLPIQDLLARRRFQDPEAAADARERRAQYAIHVAYRSFVRYMVATRVIRLRVVGAERLREPGAKLVVANHPSLVDAPLLVAQLPQADCAVSPSWAGNPVLRRCVRAAGYLRSADGPTFVREMAHRLRSGRTAVMFPEGTRSPETGVGPFGRGAAHVALQSGRPLLPVCIRFEPRMLLRGQRWWEVPDVTPRVTIEVLEPLATEEVLEGGEAPGVAARMVTAALRERFEKRLERER